MPLTMGPQPASPARLALDGLGLNSPASESGFWEARSGLQKT